MRRDNETGVTVDGRHYTTYEATQRQRQLERAIRNQKRKILIDKTVDDPDKLQTDQIRLVRLRDEYARFSKEAGLPTQHARAEAAGFTWKDGKAAEKAAKVSRKQLGQSLRTPGYTGEKAMPYSSRGIEIEQRLQDYLDRLGKDADYIVDEAGTFQMRDLAVLTTETGVEFTTLTIDGKSYLIRGYEKGTTIPSELIDHLLKKRGTLDCHSHPYIGDLRPSMEDKSLLAMLTWQDESVIIDPNQSAMTFTVHGPKGHVNVKNEKAYSYWQELFGEGD